MTHPRRLLASLYRVENHLLGLNGASHKLALEVTDMIIHLQGIVDNDPIVVKPPQTTYPEDPAGEMVEAGIHAKYLLVEIIKRAAHDWVLYKNSKSTEQRDISEDAYTWLFEEDEHHAHWRWRIREGKEFTSFISICDELDMDVDRIRGYIRNLDNKTIKNSGKIPSMSSSSQQDYNVTIHVDTSSISYEADEFDILDGIDY